MAPRDLFLRKAFKSVMWGGSDPAAIARGLMEREFKSVSLSAAADVAVVSCPLEALASMEESRWTGGRRGSGVMGRNAGAAVEAMGDMGPLSGELISGMCVVVVRAYLCVGIMLASV